MPEERSLAIFADPAAAARAIASLRERGLSRIETFAPVPDPRIDATAGASPSPVRAFTLAGGLLGGAAGIGLTVWTSLELPLVTGGKPIVSLPPFLVIAFEMTILFGALATLVGFLLNARLPRLGPGPAYDPRFGEDRYGVLVTSSPEQAALARSLLAAAGAEEVRGGMA